MPQTFLTDKEIANSCTAIYLRGLPGLTQSGTAKHEMPVRIVVTEGLVKVATARSIWRTTENWEIDAQINVNEIVDVQVFNSTELIPEEKAERSVIGRALIGGLLFGQTGAYIGAASGFRDKPQKSGDWFVAVAFVRSNISNIALFRAWDENMWGIKHTFRTLNNDVRSLKHDPNPRGAAGALYNAFRALDEGLKHNPDPKRAANILYNMIITGRQEFADYSFGATSPVVALIESDNTGHDPSGDTIMTKLADLKKLLDAGLITQQEYDAKKSELLSRF
jgi:hypothetical protein